MLPGPPMGNTAASDALHQVIAGSGPFDDDVRRIALMQTLASVRDSALAFEHNPGNSLTEQSPLSQEVSS